MNQKEWLEKASKFDVSCCTDCNLKKGTTSLEKFFEWIKKISSHHSL